MPAGGDPQTLNAQLQAVLDVANMTLSKTQLQILKQEIQKTMDGTLVSPSNPRKRKAVDCDLNNCGSASSSINPGSRVPGNEIMPTELLAGKFRCEACSKWVALRDKDGFTLAPWLAHILACGQSKLGKQTAEKPPDDSTMSQDVSRAQLPSSHSFLATLDSQTDDKSVAQLKLGRSAALSPYTKTEFSSPTSAPGAGCDELKNEAMPENSSNDHNMNVTPTVLPPTKRRRPNRTEAERMEEFLTDPKVAGVEPYRVLCAICDKWIKLRKNSRYCLIPWECHKACCGKEYPAPQSSLVVSRLAPQVEDSPNGPGNTTETPYSFTTQYPPALKYAHLELPPPSAHPSLQLNRNVAFLSSIQLVSANGESSGANDKAKKAGRARLAGTEQRRAALEADLYSETVESDRVLCALCKKWVKLRPNSAYCAAPWQSHIKRCALKYRKHHPLISRSGMDPFEESVTDDAKMAAGGDSTINPNGRKASHYRGSYDHPSDPASNEGKANSSYYYKAAPLLCATSGTPLKKRRGRPPKNAGSASMSGPGRNKSDTEMSYESEEG